MIDEVRELYAYTAWANGRVLDIVAGLDAAAFTRALGSSFSSVRETLVHMLGADWVWLSRWQGTSPTSMPESWDLSSLEAIRAKWAEVERARTALVATLTESDLRRPLAYRNMSGQPFVSTFGEMLLHVVNHSTYHRGQVVTMLRQLGAEGTDTDLITYYRRRIPGEVPATG